MKNWFKNKIWITSIIMAIVGMAYAAGVPETIPTDGLKLGKGSSTDAKYIEFNTNDSPNVLLSVDDSKNSSFSTNQFTIGDGTDTAQSMIFNQSSVDTTFGMDGSNNALLTANQFKLGDGTDTAQSFVFDQLTSDISFSVDASQNASVNSNQISFGDGAASDKSIVFNIGGSNPYFKWDNTNAMIVFSNDSSTEKSIVGSNAAGLTIYSALISQAGAHSVTSSKGTWISSVSDGGVGRSDITLTGTAFTGTPHCVCTVAGLGSQFCRMNVNTATDIDLQIGDDAGSTSDQSYFLICFGE